MKIFTKPELEAYTSEDLFTKEVVMPFFQLMAKSTFGKFGPFKVEFWGADKRSEAYYGIDVYLGYTDHLQRPKHIGIQIKIENITLGSGAHLSNSLETIRNQIKKAYDSKFTSPIDSTSRECKLNGFYLVTSKSINQTAREFYSQQCNFTNLEFLDSDSLAYFIEQLSKTGDRR